MFLQLFDRIVVNGSFWVGLVLLWAIVIIKDFYLLTLKYYGFPSDSQILREVLLWCLNFSLCISTVLPLIFAETLR